MKLENIKIEENVSLEKYNTYRLKGKTKYFIDIKDVNELIQVLKYLKENNIKYFIIGAGSNIIIDEYFDGAIIKLSGLNNVVVKDKFVEAEAGAMMAKLAITSINHNLAGLEWAINIPGTIGGSIVGNAGAYNCEMFDHLEKIKILDENLEIKEIDAKDIEHSYRYSSLKNRNIFVISATFLLEPGNKEELMETVEDRKARRMATQPLELPSAGSVFRNPENDHAGRLIEEAGLKGKRIGDAEVSTKHANFIVNKGQATSNDIKNLIKLVHDTVLEQFGIDLVLEQLIIDWD